MAGRTTVDGGAATLRLPPSPRERARPDLAGGRRPGGPGGPAPRAPLGRGPRARQAASVVLLRPGPSAVQAYLQQGHRGMPFAGGAVAFPGGGVDPRDSDRVPEWAGAPPAEFAGRLGCEEALARALVCAAVRETFE